MSSKLVKRSPEFSGRLPDLPTDTIDEILVRLPPKSIGRLRCVCKSWAALTSSPSFINAHLDHHSSKNSNHQILCTLPFWDPSHFHSIYLLRRGAGAAPLILNFPPSIRFDNHAESQLRVSSHRGLVCLWTHHPTSPIYLWNPLTGESRTLPPSRYRSSRSVRYVWAGLGSLQLSDGTKDYKVVRVSRFKNKEVLEIKAEVYSLRRGSWKDVTVNSKSPLICLCNGEVAVANQSVNWIGMQKPFGFAVASFDVEAEAFRCIEFSERGRLFMPRIGVWRGRVGVLAETETGEWEVWVMRETSWERAFVYRPGEECMERARPVGFTMGGEVLLAAKGKNRMGMVARKEWGETGVGVKMVDEEFLLPMDADVVNMYLCAFCSHVESLVSVH
ncbi:putative F-box/LRR-repeat/kelch-repeat protein At1g11620 [Malania oleifera]|uniref:putative F-box/LRR-repeat/kelch-repeat protein At1g11620 n=1 Tax=Malania oleifera TaxID=397392 RepID=UPI0025ADA027|nr:putative F-box/LRR-repeat/kelch-repeat protein At1g11620 [Malania oleifera]